MTLILTSKVKSGLPRGLAESVVFPQLRGVGMLESVVE